MPKETIFLFFIIVFLFFLLGCLASQDSNKPTVLDVNTPANSGANQKSAEESKIEALFNSFIRAELDCNIESATSMITEKSKEIVHYTCSNMENEAKCYVGRKFEIRAKENIAVLFLAPYSRKIENPFFFLKENSEWKIDLYKMANGLVMAGSGCDSGWGWRDLNLHAEFCSYFNEGACPDKNPLGTQNPR